MNLEALSSNIPMNTTDHGESSNLGPGVIITTVTVLGVCTLILIVAVILLLLMYTRRKRRVNKTK